MVLRDAVVEAYRGALPTLLVSAVGGLIAGAILSGMDADLAAVQGLLVMVPAFLAIRGSVYGSLGSKLSSALHQGLIEPRLHYDWRLRNAVVAAVLNGVTASLFAALATFVIFGLLGRRVAPLWMLAVIAVLGGILAGLVLVAVIVTVVLVGYQRGLNPDNIVGPTVTTAGDVFGMAALLVATRVALALL